MASVLEALAEISGRLEQLPERLAVALGGGGGVGGKRRLRVPEAASSVDQPGSGLRGRRWPPATERFGGERGERAHDHPSGRRSPAAPDISLPPANTAATAQLSALQNALGSLGSVVPSLGRLAGVIGQVQSVMAATRQLQQVFGGGRARELPDMLGAGYHGALSEFKDRQFPPPVSTTALPLVAEDGQVNRGGTLSFPARQNPLPRKAPEEAAPPYRPPPDRPPRAAPFRRPPLVDRPLPHLLPGVPAPLQTGTGPGATLSYPARQNPTPPELGHRGQWLSPGEPLPSRPDDGPASLPGVARSSLDPPQVELTEELQEVAKALKSLTEELREKHGEQTGQEPTVKGQKRLGLGTPEPSTGRRGGSSKRVDDSMDVARRLGDVLGLAGKLAGILGR